MSHALSIAQGIALAQPERRIWCIDGDGALLMHMGSLVSTAALGTQNIVHVLLNNSCHESVGGQKTFSENLNIKQISKAFKFKSYYIIKTKKDMKRKLKLFLKSSGPSFLEVKIKNQSLKNLTRPKNLIDIKKKFIK